MAGDRRPRLRVHEGAAARRQHLRAVFQHAQDDALLQRPELGLAIALEQFGNAHARHAFDLLVAVDEGQAQRRRDLAADRRLAGAHQADKDDRTRCAEHAQAGSAAVCSRATDARTWTVDLRHQSRRSVLPAYRHEKPDCVKRAACRPASPLNWPDRASHKGRGSNSRADVSD